MLKVIAWLLAVTIFGGAVCLLAWAAVQNDCKKITVATVIIMAGCRD